MATKSEELSGSGCFSRAADDEPVFVLRAQDALAPDMVRTWAAQAAHAGCPERKVHEARMLADKMDRWAADNGSKVPD